MSKKPPTPEPALIVRRPSGQYIKGVSGNPGGRPGPQAQLKEAARLYMTEALATLVDAMRATKQVRHYETGETEEQPDYVTRVRAATAILDRGFGTPAQTLEVAREDGERAPIDLTLLTDDELRALQSIRQKLVTAESEAASDGAGDAES